MGHEETKAPQTGRWQWRAEGRGARVPAPAWGPVGAAPGPQALDTQSVTGTRGRRPREGPGAGQNGQGAGRSQGGRQEGGEGGEPCPSVPSVPAAHPAGKPGPQLLWPARPRIASLPGRAAPARSASARNRARFGGPQAAGEGPPRLQGALGSRDPGSRQSLGCGDLERGPGTGQGAGRDPGLGAGRGQGLGRGRCAGGWTSERRRGLGARGPGAGSRRGRGPGSRARGQREASGGALTSQPARKPARGGRADGRTEEFAAGGAVGRVRVCSRPRDTAPLRSGCHSTGGTGTPAHGLRGPPTTPDDPAPCSRPAWANTVSPDLTFCRCSPHPSPTSPPTLTSLTSLSLSFPLH